MESKEELTRQLENLQNQVKQQEKLASLGMLTAGIVHEIRNPLNFVINFSKLSEGLLIDLKEDITEISVQIKENDISDVQEIIEDLNQNIQKIKEHGERATSIIQNILLYSRGKEDEFIPTDVCKLVREYIWLSYHAMRANYAGFNISIEEQYQSDLPQMSVIPQDLSRAVLNVMNNACYAVWKRQQDAAESNYAPAIRVEVSKSGDELRIIIADNGIGMNEEVKCKLFDAFFTTKPVGHGTGLGMSITRDIIVNKHHGRIEFSSEEHKGTSFLLIIPVKQ